jgi:hypothetical protein
VKTTKHRRELSDAESGAIVDEAIVDEAIVDEFEAADD